MAEIILHHYGKSTFAAKARAVLGFKNLAWRSVIIPDRMPKPDLMPLTGGYRSTPVMQIGADVYCDTQRIIGELERRHPEPTLFPDHAEGLAWAMSFWTDKTLYTTVVGMVFGANADKLDAGYVADRVAHRGGQLDIAKLKAEVAQNRAQAMAQFDWVEKMLADGRDFVLGTRPGLADIDIYFVVWLVRALYPTPTEVLAPFPRLGAWADRVAAFGEGRPRAMTAEDALEVARTSHPEAPARAQGDALIGIAPGDAVTVVPDDKGRVAVSGRLLTCDRQAIALRRFDERLGEVVVHFPRAGFQVFAG